MSLAATFIHRPVATTLLTLGVALAGLLAFLLLPVAPLPQVDFPTIAVSANLPGASPETMAATVATPLERSLGRIAGVTEMTSSSSQGNTRIILQFDLDRDINGAARDVQAAINAARSLLPTSLPGNPTYKKINPADAPVMIVALTSDTLSQGRIYDAASSIVAQKLAQVDGVGQVQVGGSSLPAVRVELNPHALNKYGLSLEQVRTALAASNANTPKGSIEHGDRHWQIQANDQANHAADYLPLVISYRNGAAVRLADVARVDDSVEDLRNAGLANGKPSVTLMIYREPGANIIDTVDRVKALLPNLEASIPRSINTQVVMDRTTTIRSSLLDVEKTLAISVGLVILVVFLFLRNGRATLIPAVAVPVSLIGTFGVMYLCGYSLDNLSLMALTIATGFVVDDAIVVLENIARHREAGMPPFKAALQGAREVSFTVLSMSLSLISVFIPILAMGGIVGRLFREFAVTLSVAILVSLVVSLTTTPTLCAYLLGKTGKGAPQPAAPQGPPSFWRRFLGGLETLFDDLQDGYRHSLAWALDHSRLVLTLLLATVGLTVYLYIIIPKGFFPQQDTGRIMGMVQADQAISFQSMRQKMEAFQRIIMKDPAVAFVAGYTGGGQRNGGMMFMSLKPLKERKVSSDEVINRLRKKLAHVPGASLFLQSAQDVRVGGRPGNAQYQFTLQADDLAELRAWEPRVKKAMEGLPELEDVSSDSQDAGISTYVTIDRDTAARMGITASRVDATLNDAFGQRQVSTLYAPLNQYHVVMEVAPEYWQHPEALGAIYVPGGTQAQTTGLTANSALGGASSPNGSATAMVPLSAIARFGPGTTPLAVNHQGQFAASTLFFNLKAGVSLSQAAEAINGAIDKIGAPTSIHGSFQGTAKVFGDSLHNQPLLILAAVVAMYIVLGVLYESYIHPLTILSTIPSAGVGALLALLAFGMEFTVIALIGVLLLIGIVKKNAIMMIDFAIEAQRRDGLEPKEAIFRACQLRFRPIMMTTMAALLGAVPLAIGGGEGAELRQPLGVAIVGGLALSQLLTLYTTPVVYLYMDRFRLWWERRRGRKTAPLPALNEQ